MFYSADSTCGECMDDVGGRGVPGVVPGWVGTRRGYTGYYPPSKPEAGLRLIYRIYEIDWFIRPFDWI